MQLTERTKYDLEAELTGSGLSAAHAKSIVLHAYLLGMQDAISAMKESIGEAVSGA